jgi:hypothetical protein
MILHLNLSNHLFLLLLCLAFLIKRKIVLKIFYGFFASCQVIFAPSRKASKFLKGEIFFFDILTNFEDLVFIVIYVMNDLWFETFYELFFPHFVIRYKF